MRQCPAGVGSISRRQSVHLYSSLCPAGADSLLQLLKNYARNAGLKSALTVGVVGLPNVGKSSVINSLKRSRVAQVCHQGAVAQAFALPELAFQACAMPPPANHMPVRCTAEVVYSFGWQPGSGMFRPCRWGTPPA